MDGDAPDSEVSVYKYLRRLTRINTIDDLESADMLHLDANVHRMFFSDLIQLSHVTLSSSHLVLLPTE